MYLEALSPVPTGDPSVPSAVRAPRAMVASFPPDHVGLRPLFSKDPGVLFTSSNFIIDNFKPIPK